MGSIMFKEAMAYRAATIKRSLSASLIRALSLYAELAFD